MLPQLTPTAKPLDTKALTQIIHSPCCSLFVAIDEDTVIGCLTLVLYRIPSRIHAWIEDVVVTSSARGSGVGEALVRHAIHQAEIQKAARIGLSSSPQRMAANRLYRKIGFQEQDTNVYLYHLHQETGSNEHADPYRPVA